MKKIIYVQEKKERAKNKPWGTPHTTVLLEETRPLPWSKRENPGNEIVDFFGAAVILKHKALWAAQGAKQKQRCGRLDIQESDLKLGLFHNLEDISEIDGLLLVQTEEERFS